MNEFNIDLELSIYRTLIDKIICPKNKEGINLQTGTRIIRGVSVSLRSMAKSKNIDEFNFYKYKFYIRLNRATPALIKSKTFTKEEIMEMLQREGE